jgi:release factor glutamine methyltransferase
VALAQGGPLSDDVKNFEPALALYGGDQGDEILKQWLPKMTGLLKPGGLILCEMGFDQKKSVEKIFASTSAPQNEYNCVVVKDLSGHDRVAKIWR